MTENTNQTTILVDVADKRRLDRKKVHKREPYSEVVKRVLDELEESKSDLEDGGTMGNVKQSGRASRIDELVETTAQELGRISKGRLAGWTPKDRSHEKLLRAQAKGD